MSAPLPPPVPEDSARLQARLAGILDVALDCIVTVDHEGRFIDFNPAAERTFGYKKSDVLGREMTELIVPPALRAGHRGGMARMLSGGAPRMLGQRIEITAMRADGTEFPVELAITRLAVEGPPIFTAHLRDITDRKRSEAELLALQRELERRIADRTADLDRMRAALEATAASQRESQAYFEKSFHSSPALMSLARADDGRLIEVNPAFLFSSGYTREEVLGRSTLDLGIWLHPEQRDTFISEVRRAGLIRDFESDFRTKTGQIRTLILNADIVELGGEPCVLNVGIDVTERRRRDQVQAATYQVSQLVLAGGELPELFAELHRIVGALVPARNFYVALLSPDRSLLSFPYFVDETAPTPAPRKPGAGLTEYVLNTARPLRTTAREFTILIRGEKRYQPTGIPAALWLGAPLMIDGRAIGVITVQDYHNPEAYTDADLQLLMFVADQIAAAVHRQQAGEALRKAEQQYRGIFENALEGLYQSSPAGRFLNANSALARMCGYTSPAELIAAMNDIGRQFYVLPDRRAEFLELVKKSDEVPDFESEVYRADGSRVWISESVRVVRNAAGEIDHFEGLAIDITQQREAASALQAAKEAADAASRAKSHFLASVSHELRTPLNGILGFTQILRRDASLGERPREGVRIIHESAEHLLALINDVLDLSKIEAGRIELHPADFDLHGFAVGVERVFVSRAKEKNLLLETSLAPDLPRFARGDEQRLRQIVFNLVGNAVKFTTAGGVVFSVQLTPNALVRFSVSDTGPGIAAENLTRIFEPFTQVGDRTQAASGTGLGLAISRSLVERMGGKLYVESRPGWGSRFWFEVPLPAACCDTPPVTATARRVTGYEGPRRRVLAVDDNAANRTVMVEMLTPLGFELAEAADGETAVALAAEFKPDLVLMDLRLPGKLDGLAATRALRAREGGAALRILAVSASAYDIDRRECFAAGCDDFLAKPFREEELWTTLERLLGLTWHFAEPEETRSPFPLVLTPPPEAEAGALYELAQKGDVVGIRARAQALAALDARYAPFAQSVLDLAARFKMKAIRQFVARYLPPAK